MQALGIAPNLWKAYCCNFACVLYFIRRTDAENFSLSPQTVKKLCFNNWRKLKIGDLLGCFSWFRAIFKANYFHFCWLSIPQSSFLYTRPWGENRHSKSKHPVKLQIFSWRYEFFVKSCKSARISTQGIFLNFQSLAEQESLFNKVLLLIVWENTDDI